MRHGAGVFLRNRYHGLWEVDEESPTASRKDERILDTCPKVSTANHLPFQNHRHVNLRLLLSQASLCEHRRMLKWNRQTWKPRKHA